MPTGGPRTIFPSARSILYANPLLREPLKIEHVKPRLLGHWGTTPGLNFIYAHFNRLIKKYDLNVINIAGPGHGGPGIVANTYLEGTYTELYPDIPQNEEGMRKLFKQFSFPGGIPSHAAPETPGSINEGGELGYSLAHAYGAVFDNPDLLACCVVGDGEAETGALATSWHSNKFLNPARDGAVLPILHLNGYKIANPTVLGRLSDEELTHLFNGYGYKPHFVEGHEPEPMHQLMAATLDTVIGEIREIQEECAFAWIQSAAHLADDRDAHAERLDRTESCGWQAGGRYMARAPGAGHRFGHQARSSQDSGRLDEELCSRGAFRRDRQIPQPNWPNSRPQATGGWAQTRTPMAACCSRICSCRIFATTP